MITIKRIDGTPIIDVQERDDSKFTRVLMGEHNVRIRFDWNVFIPLPYGSFIEWKGKRFSIWGEYTPVQREGAFEYDIPFEAEERELNNYLFFYLSAGKMEHQWKLTAPIEQALKEVQANLDRIHGKGAWVIRNQVGTTPTKLLEFDSTSVFDALTKIAEAYGTEWRSEGRTLYFGRMSEGARERLSLGGEASRFEPQGDTAQLISRLYAFGSSRNVKSGKRLTLPDDTPFISGTLRGKEAVKIFDDVYPKYNGTISSVSFRSVKEGNIYTIADSALKITQDKLLAGQTLKATFESGALNGLTFDLSITSQGYEIVPNNEYGGRLPSDTLKPAVGDKYVPHGFDIDLVGKEYVPRARTTLKEKAFRWLQENNEDTRDVEVVLNPIAVAERSISITIGKPITLVNALAGGDKVGYITKIEYPLYSPESVTIVVGKAKPLGFIERLKQEGKDEASLIVHELVTPQLNAQQKAVLDVQAMITDADTNATAKTTQALSEAKSYADGKTNDALAEVARINTALKTELEGKVSALLSNVANIQGNLQKQIDKQVEMYWGEQPPKGRIGWTEADDAKHEGDTYTVRPPEGVTITPQNAKQYPNVGKSWRWHSNGWIEIADTDVTRALALAGEAKASADGKVTHFRGSSIPTGYKQGDLWTLTSAWNGFKQGSILTATQDEVIGQYNPTHWKEEVRYTDDTAIRTLSIGGRNLIKNSNKNQERKRGYLMAQEHDLTEDWKAGETYTISVCCGIERDKGVLLYIWGGTYQLAEVTNRKNPEDKDGLKWGVYTATFTISESTINSISDWHKKTYEIFQNGGEGDFILKWVKLEKGNKATDYTEAPEDTAEAIKKVDTDSTTKASQALNDAKAFAREEDEKRDKALRAEIMQDYLRQVIKDGSTFIKGGLLATNVIALKSTNGNVSSYIDGNEANNIAFAAGVTDAFTPNEKRAVEITHDGNARFGQMHLNGHDGVLSFAPIGSAESYLNIGGIPRELDDLLGSTFNGDKRKGDTRFDLTSTQGQDLEQTQELVGSINIPKDGTAISFSGKFHIEVDQVVYHDSDSGIDYDYGRYGDDRDYWAERERREEELARRNNTTLKRHNAIAKLEIVLIKIGERGEEVKLQILNESKSYDDGRSHITDIFTASTTLEKGVYKIIARCTLLSTGVHTCSTKATASILTDLTQKNAEVHIGNKAMYAVFGRENFLHVSEQGTTIKGRTDMPGVLAAGIANMSGTVQNAYGAKVNRLGYEGAWCERQRDNSYKVYHSIGHSNYSVQVTVFGDSRDAGCVMDIQNYYFTCCFYNPVDTYKEQHNFTYLCIGPNTK